MVVRRIELQLEGEVPVVVILIHEALERAESAIENKLQVTELTLPERA